MTTTEFVSNLFAARDVLHLMHLHTKSYAEHKALGGIYPAIEEFTDSFVETYQGQVGDLINVTSFTVSMSTPDPIAYLENFCDSVLVEAKNAFATDMEQYGHYVNNIEELISTVYHTIYKLKFLK